MTDITDALNRIEEAAKASLPALAKAADVPYSTAAELRGKAWRTRAVITLERLSRAADVILAEAESPVRSHFEAA